MLKENYFIFQLKKIMLQMQVHLELIVYNNIEGIFFGELIHEFWSQITSPQIPVVSIDREEGLEIKKISKNKIEGFCICFTIQILLHILVQEDQYHHSTSNLK